MGLAAALCAGAAGCGKKGPPLAPLVRIPAAVETIDAARVGRDVYVTLTIPAENVDEFAPADVARVEVYGYTGPAAPPRGRFVEFATRIAVIPVAPPPTGGAAAPGVEAPVQGASVTVRDTLTSDELSIPAPSEPRTPNEEPRTPNEEPRTRNEEPRTANQTPNKNPEPGTGNRELRRFYTAYAFSPRDRPGPPGAVTDVPLLPLPDAPPRPATEYTEREVTVRWQPPSGMPAHQAPAATEEAAEPLTYNVYRTIVPDPLEPPEAAAAAWNAAPPAPINPAPLTALTFADGVEFGAERCYTVRAVRGAGAGARVGEASPPACVMPVDTFPPAAPRSLAAVATEGAISLIWQPNAERDLGGYVVLRGEAPGDTLQPLTPTPLADARYRDDAVTPGMRYVYAVVALDSRFPVPNVSAQSERVEEMAR